ncbi:M10 family metallopeptidase [Thioclava sp. 'Guangxiensis']|uniref:M10 family metallopeptidase n=1 Tax=Thioclava sp. 'Guangxiensis' TaxID=3149044 RepID=UPI0038783113
MCLLCQSLNPAVTGYDSHGLTNLESGTGNSMTSASLPTYTLDQAAKQLTNDFWTSVGAQQRSFSVSTGGQLTVNLTKLTGLAKTTALEALEAWEQVTGLTFVQTTGTASITFQTSASGAYATSSTSGNTILSSVVNVNNSWQNYGDYYLQTYIHEIGHALGLGHAGSYNGSANFGTDAVFANDSWAISVMSYFDQLENPNSTFSYAFVATPMLADIVAIQTLYGSSTTVNTGNTVYGDSTSLSQTGMDLKDGWAVCLYDNGGTDTINLSSRSANQRIDLNAETYSDIEGKTGNLSIARGTIIENALTGSGNDTVTGNTADNLIITGAGNDAIYAGAGNDTLVGGAGSDTLVGGSGADVFSYTAVTDAGDRIADFSGTDGDRIDVSALLDSVGYTGSDAVADGLLYLSATSGGSNLIFDPYGTGAGGTVTLAFLAGVSASTPVSGILDGTAGGAGGSGSGLDTVYSYTNADVLGWARTGHTITDLDGGSDTLDFSAYTGIIKLDLASGAVSKIGARSLTLDASAQIENAVLGAGRDQAYGNEADNTIDGRAGNDKIYGMSGDDSLLGGAGNDMLYGGEGTDSLLGETGNDQLYGEAGDDLIDGGEGNNRLYAGIGNDVVYAGAGNDLAYGDAGDDYIDAGDGTNRLYAGDGNDTVYAGAGADKIYADLGDDLIDAGDGNNMIYAGAGNDIVTAGDGNDRIDAGAGDDVINAGDGRNNIAGGAGIDIIFSGSGKDQLKGDAGDDLLDSGAESDMLKGGDGNDILFAGDGDDRAYGDNDDDQIDGGAGNDLLSGGNGHDTLSGGEGNDRVNGDAGDDLIYGGAGDDRLSGLDGADTILGDDGADILTGLQGNDSLSGGAGDDRLDGGTEDDVLDGGDGIDKLAGGTGNDTLLGGAGADDLNGGAGDDILTGGLGADILRGGAGADTFAFTDLGDAGDLVADFSIRLGDKIDISYILADLGFGLDDAVSGGVVSLTAINASTCYLDIDTDGAAGSGDAIHLATLRGLSAATEIDSSWFV